MLRRNQLIGTAALALACSLPASAAVAQQDLRMPDNRDAPSPSSIAAPEDRGYQDLRMPDNRAPGAAETRRSPQVGPPGVYSQRDREINRQFQSTPQYKRSVLQTRLERLEREAGTAAGTPAPVIEVREVSSGGFDWADAGIGAAGMLALFSIGAGSTLLVTNRRRQRGFQVPAH
jgi:hypothetical protein